MFALLQVRRLSPPPAQFLLRQGPSYPTGGSGLKELLYYEFISSLIRDQEFMARTVSHYAKQLEVSADHLNIAVRETSGFTAMEWINRVTIDLSEVLLSEKKMSISEVAHKMGFVEQPSFSRFFKKETGMTPMEYRNGKGIPLGEA